MTVALVTGAGGMLGRALAASAPPGVALLALPKAELDVTDRAAVRERVRSVRPDFVLHTAAYTDVDGAERESERCLRVNGIGAENAASAAREAGAGFLLISTDFVFDGRKREPYVEWDPPSPLGAYARSKWWAERLVEAAHPTPLVVRTQWLFGPGGNHFVRAILERARAGGEVAVVEDQVGCPTYAPDVARVLWRLVGEGAVGLYHCANHGPCSWYDFARAIARGAGLPEARIVPTTTEALGRPAPRPAYSALRNLHLEVAGGDPMRPWPEALDQYLREGAP